jgi:hypothetical protein
MKRPRLPIDFSEVVDVFPIESVNYLTINRWVRFYSDKVWRAR